MAERLSKGLHAALSPSWRGFTGAAGLAAGIAFPPEWCVKAAYPGRGRVAQPGFTNPVWVDGLLVAINKKTAARQVTRVATRGAKKTEVTPLITPQ